MVRSLVIGSTIPPPVLAPPAFCCFDGEIADQTLAETIGTTRSRINVFRNTFKKQGFIEYNGGLKVNHSLLTIIMHE